VENRHGFHGVGVDVLVEVDEGVTVGRGVCVRDGVQVGGGGLVGVRVQVGMGVRVDVGVTDSAAMNVLLSAVRVAEVALIVGVCEGAGEAVAEGAAVEVGVAEADCVEV
jgi:hypothetical protein